MPLTGVSVLDLTRVLAGPFATQILADMGATVYKIENPQGGDDSRAFPPFGLNDTSAYFAGVNRGKQSLAIDMSDPQGSELVQELAEQVDVVVDNFKPGTLAKWGLDYATISPKNPGLVWCSISGFGENTARATTPAYDIIIQAMSGFMSITGYPESGPTRAGTSLADLITGTFAACQVCAGLAARNADPDHRGRYIDLAMMDSMVAFSETAVALASQTGIEPGRVGNRHPAITPFQLFTASDTEFVLAAGTQKNWHKLCNAIDRPDLPQDERFVDNVSRTQNVAALVAELDHVFGAQPRDHWLKILADAGVPCGPIQGILDVLADPGLHNRNMLLDAPELGLTLAATPCATHASTDIPTLGSSTHDVLTKKLGLSEETLQALTAQGTIATSS